VNIVVDENIPRRTVEALRKSGHTVIDPRETTNKGIDDASLWTWALRESALLITTDKGFAQVKASPHSGILIVRLRQPNRFKIHERIMMALSRFAVESWPNHVVVMRDRSQSVRRTKNPGRAER
jgi:predicted nuclease of predicted toxin-antitoxin system